MNKGLEALHQPRIKFARVDISAEGYHDIAYMPFDETKQYTVIEKYLKAFDIMLENNVDLSILRRSRTCEEYNRQSYRRLSKEHFDFLKEQIR